MADAGPAFDARQSDELAGEATSPPRLEVLPGGGPLQVEEDTIRGTLIAQGELAHLLASAGHPEAWRYTEADLKAIAPPLTRIINRYPAAAEAVATIGDPAAAGLGLFNYGLRSLQQRQSAVREAQEAAEFYEEPITGAYAEPGTGPPEREPATGPGPEVAGGGPQPPTEVEWNT